MGPTITHILFWTQLIIRKQNKQYVLGISQLYKYTLFMLTFVLVLLFYWPVVLNSCIHWYFSLVLSFIIKLIKIVQQRLRLTSNETVWKMKLQMKLFSLLLIISVVWVIDLEILRSYDHCSFHFAMKEIKVSLFKGTNTMIGLLISKKFRPSYIGMAY